VLSEHIHSLSNLGLHVRAVDLPPCATYRSVHRTMVASGSQNLTGLGAMLDIGHLGSQFFITRGEDLVFYKQMDLGGRKIDEAVAAKLGISLEEAIQMRARLVTDSTVADESEPLTRAMRDAMRAPLEELAKELDMCIRYYVVTFRGSRPDSILLTGRQAGCAPVREALASALSLRVDEAQPLRGVNDLGDAARPDRSGEWAVAAGLSLYPLHTPARTEAA
jgi:type IV pilus assembly protein PilM